MITSFRSDAAAALYHARQSSHARRMPPAARARLLRRLDMINAAHDLDDLRSLSDGPTEVADEEQRRRVDVGGNLQISFRWEHHDASVVAIEERAA